MIIGNKVCGAIKKIYPEIKGGYSYWETQRDEDPETGKYLGEKPWINPIDGLKWDNIEYSKPSWGQLEVKFADIILQEAKDRKKAEINNQRDINVNADEGYTMDGVRYHFQKGILPQLAFINTISSGDDVAVHGWITADNKIIDITKNQLIGICRHIRTTDSIEFIQARKRKDAVMDILPTDIKTVEECLVEVEAFDINQVFI